MAAVGDYAAEWADQMDSLLVWCLEQGKKFTLTDVGKAETTRSALYQRVRKFFATYDLLLLPTTVAPPFPARIILCQGTAYGMILMEIHTRSILSFGLRVLEYRMKQFLNRRFSIVLENCLIVRREDV
jgi:hypothetical protein